MSSQHKNLNHYFNSAKAQTPLVPLEELSAQLGSFSAGGSILGKASAVAEKRFNLWVAGSAGSLVTAMAVWAAFTYLPKAEKTETAVAAMVPTEEPKKEIQEAAAPLTTVLPAQKKMVKAAATPTVKEPEEILWTAQAVATKASDIELGRDPHALFYNKQLGAIPMGHKESETAQKEGEKVFDKIYLLELPREVEQKLGIAVSEKGILYTRHFYKEKLGAGRMEFSIYNGRHAVNVFRSFKGDNSAQVAEQSTVSLAYISDRNGEGRVKYNQELGDKAKTDSAYFNEIANTLFPVLVKANNAAQDEAIFWFESTPEFLSLLPPPLTHDIAKEQNILVNQKQEITDSAKVHPAPEAGAGTQLKYFESNPRSFSPIQYAVVFPNPASEWLHLSMNLKREEEMRVSLVDINGKLVRVLLPYQRYSGGAITKKFDVKNEVKGIYILLVEFKYGHKHTQRIILE